MRDKDISDRVKYVRSLFAKEDSILVDIDKQLHANNKAIHLGAEEARLLQVLIRMNNVQTIVELGTLAGYSTIWLARALGVNGKIYTVEKDDNNFNQAKQNFLNLEDETKNKIELIHGSAEEVLEKNLSLISDNISGFDMIFIDANKTGYIKYLDWAEKHIKKGGLIIGDNTFLFDNVFKEVPDKGITKNSQKVMQEFNLRLADSNKYTSIMLPFSEGMTIAIKEF